MTRASAGPLRGRWLEASLDALACAGIASAIWVPNAAFLAGRAFSGDQFFHWNHFVVAPALAWRSGLALGSDVYSQYGLGWPVLMALLGDAGTFSHQGVIEIAVLYACVYFLGLYALLRCARATPLLAAAGVLLALGSSLFSPLFATSGATGMWQWPSLSPLRSPLDVFLFLALLRHAQTGRPAWALAAGALVGLGLFVETDGGLLLLGVFAVYWACVALSDLRVTRPLVTAAGSAALGLALLAAGLSLASRGALLREPGVLLAGWLGGVANSSAGGVGTLAFNVFLRDDAWLLPWFFGALGICLFAVGHTLSRVLHGRLAPLALLAGCVGVYGAGRLTLFVWRSYPIRLVLVAVPVAILVTLAVTALWRALGAWLERGAGGAWRPQARALQRGLPLALVAGLCAWLALDPVFQRYPNAWTDADDVRQQGYLAPERREVAGLSRRDRLRFRYLRQAIERVRADAAAGATVAVIDDTQTAVCLEAGVPPWSGDASPYMNTWTLEQQRALAARLEAERPDVVLIRRAARVDSKLRDTWQALHTVLERDYRQVETLDLYEVWRSEGVPAR